jgi:DNA polymerase-3 subunit alpha
MSSPFVHLHCHTEYSLLDGAGTIKKLLQRAKELEQPALAITDHGNMYGVLDFYRNAKELKIKPIIGYEAYIAVTNRFDKSGKTQKEACHHLTLLAMNHTGYQNLIKMSSTAFLEGKHFKPRIDKDLLREYNEGIICLSGCASSELSRIFCEEMDSGIEKAKETAAWFREIFGDRYYIELQNNGLVIQQDILTGCAQVAKELGIPTAATNDVHYIYQKDSEAQDILLCVNTKAKRSDSKRMRMDSNEFFLRSYEEMKAALPAYEDAVQRTVEIADRCNVEIELGKRFFPVFHTPDEQDHDEFLREWCLKGLKERYANNPQRCVNGELSAEVMERLNRELGVIKQLQFTDYFLIVGDFVREAEERGIHRTARGSGVGSLVCYAMKMSHVCPLEYDLLFERFLDPSRPQAPDIDIDFDDNLRDEIIEYCRDKYGRDNVGRLGTFGTMAAKGSIKDVGRTLDFPIPFVNGITKLIPEKPGTKIDDALIGKKDKSGAMISLPNDELKKRYEDEPQVKEMIDFAKQVEGLARNTGVHACGVVIADKPLTDYLPLQLTKDKNKNKDKDKKKDKGKDDDSVIVTQWEGPDVEAAGLLKMDFLGLKNLGILAETIKIIKETTGEDIDVYNLPNDSPKVFELFQRGESKGIFQFESGGMREWMIRLKPDNIRDLIALNALYRPGPMDNIPKYIAVKHGREKAVYAHKILEEVLKETYGVIVYQEQIMRLFNMLGGIPLGESYDVIKAISKKNEEKIVKYRSKFVDGAKQQGLTSKQAEDIFEDIAKFAGYGFNKSHATAYANLAYITAYLKVHYPLQFMAALLCGDIGNKKSLVEHIKDCERMGIEVLPPDINTSDTKFTVKDGKITFALEAIQRCGEKAMNQIVEARKKGKFRSLYDFCERVPNTLVNKGAIESLVKAGAFDSIGSSRKQMFEQVEQAMRDGQKTAASAAKGQSSIFGMLEDDVPAAKSSGKTETSTAKIDDWDVREKSNYEKEVLGFYVSDHPLKSMEEFFEQYRTHSCDDAAYEPEEKTGVIVAGEISEIKISTYKNLKPNRPNQWAGFTLEDATGSVRCIMWAEEYAKYAEMFKDGQIVFAVGKVDRSKAAQNSDKPENSEEGEDNEDEQKSAGNLIVDDFYTVEQMVALLTRGITLMLDERRHTGEELNSLYKTLRNSPGDRIVEICARLQNGATVKFKSPKIRVTVGNELRQAVNQLLGSGAVRILKNPLPQKEKKWDGWKNYKK